MIRTPLSCQKGQGQLVADVLNSQLAGTGATWRINTKILSTCGEWRSYYIIRCVTLSGIITEHDEQTRSSAVELWFLRRTPQTTDECDVKEAVGIFGHVRWGSMVVTVTGDKTL